MRKLFGLLSLLLSIYTVQAQEETAATINAADFPAAMYNGTPDIRIPLFETSTRDANFNLNFNMRYDLPSATSLQLSTGTFIGSWSMDVFGSIVRNSGMPSEGPFRYESDEEYYEYLSNNDETRTKSASDLFSFNTPSGISGKFRVKRIGNDLETELHGASQNLKVELDYSSIPSPDKSYGRKFRIAQFTIKDDYGYNYTYAHYDSIKLTKSSMAGGLVERYFRTNYYITSITDKFGNDLVTYEYRPDDNSAGNPRMVPERIIIKDIGYVSFINDSGNIIIEQRSDNNELVQKARIYSGWSTNSNTSSIVRIEIFGKDSAEPRQYRMEYHTNFNPTEGSNMSCLVEPDRKKYWLDQFGSVLRKIKTPEGASIFYDFEANDVNAGDETAVTPGGAFYKAIMDSYYDNPANYEFENVPYTYNSSENRYYFTADSTFYYTYKPSKLYTSGDPLNGIPLQTGDHVRLYREIPAGSGNYQEIEHNSNPATGLVCENFPHSYALTVTEPTSFYLGVIDDDTEQVLSEVEFAQIRPKPYSELEKRIRASGLRIKRKVVFDKDVSELSYQARTYDPPAEEIVYEYKDFDNPGKSSGKNGSSVAKDIQLWEFVFYENVRVKKTGSGYVEYTFDNGKNYEGTSASVFSKNKSINVYPKKIERFSESGQLLESSEFERTYLPNLNHDHSECGNFCDYVVDVGYEKVTSEAYFPGSTTKKLSTITESTFDHGTRLLTNRTVTDNQLNQTFEERREYQKLGNSIYQTAVKKYKGGSMINQSEAEYAPLNSSTLADVYALQNSSVAKGTLPLEIEKEITRYDDYGNVLEYKTKEGLYVSQIWGYNNTKVVAELKNLRYTDIASGTITNIKNSSKSSSYNETNLITALNSLRTAHPDAFVTTYTFIPMVGMKTTTDANGRKETYEYDSFNRLHKIINHEGNVVKEYKYNIKN